MDGVTLRPGFWGECIRREPGDSGTYRVLSRLATESPEQACSWIRIALRTLSSALDAEADFQADEWLYTGGTSAALRVLRRRQPYTFTVASAGIELEWTVSPVLYAPLALARACAREQVGTVISPRSRFDGQPWPEFLDRRPVLVVPASPDRAVTHEDGWAEGSEALATAEPNRSWSAVLTRSHLTIRRPGGLPWFTGEITATREWRRAVRNHRSLLLITGPFADPSGFRPAAAAGRLSLLATPARLESDL